MKKLFGRPGSLSGLSLRIGQCMCASISIGIVITTVRFCYYTAFWYLIASMVLQVLWSLGLACLDIYALRKERDLQNPIVMSLFVVGDWVTAILALAGASSAVGLMVWHAKDLDFACNRIYSLACTNYGAAIAFALLNWILISISSHVNFWILLSSG